MNNYDNYAQISLWTKIVHFFKKALPYQETEYFELGDSSFVTVYTKWFGFILAYSIFQVYNSTTIVSGSVTVGSIDPENAPIEAETIEQLINNAPSTLYEAEEVNSEVE